MAEDQGTSLDKAPPTTPQSAPATLGIFGTMMMRFGVIGEMMTLFATGKRWWMAPLVLMLGLLGLLLSVLNSFEVVAPFIYMAF